MSFLSRIGQAMAGTGVAMFGYASVGYVGSINRKQQQENLKTSLATLDLLRERVQRNPDIYPPEKSSKVMALINFHEAVIVGVCLERRIDDCVSRGTWRRPYEE